MVTRKKSLYEIVLDRAFMLIDQVDTFLHNINGSHFIMLSQKDGDA